LIARVPGVQNVIGNHNNTIIRAPERQNCPKMHTISEQVNEGQFEWAEVRKMEAKSRKWNFERELAIEYRLRSP
jgi:hypothetical protein